MKKYLYICICLFDSTAQVTSIGTVSTKMKVVNPYTFLTRAVNQKNTEIGWNQEFKLYLVPT